MTQIQKGDQIKVTIQGPHTGGPAPTLGTFPGNEFPLFWPGREDTVTVELVSRKKPEPKFKVGDRVQFKTNRYRIERRRSGTGMVVCQGGDYHQVAIDGSDDWFGYWESELTRLPRSSVEFKLRPGDKIRNTKSGREGKVLDDRCVYDFSTTYLVAALTRVPAAAIEEYEEHYPGTYEIIERNGQPF